LAPEPIDTLALALCQNRIDIRPASAEKITSRPAISNSAQPRRTVASDLGGRFGVSRTHVRELLEEAEQMDLVRLSKGSGRYVELLPPVLQAFDRLVADAMSGFDLCYQLALRA